MAPATNAAKNLQGHRVRPTATKAVTPALPIQYTQKRKQNVVAKKPETEREPPTSAAQIDVTPESSAPEVPVTVANGSADAPESQKGEVEQLKDGGKAEGIATSKAAKVGEGIKEPEVAAQREPTQGKRLFP